MVVRWAGSSDDNHGGGCGATKLRVGIDAGKSAHDCVVIDGDGQRLLSRRVANDETVLLELIDAVVTLADGGEVTWAIDMTMRHGVSRWGRATEPPAHTRSDSAG